MYALRCFPLALILAVVALAMPATSIVAGGPEEAIGLHGEYDRLLGRYVRELGVDYASWAAESDDVAALDDYVDGLTALNPDGWSPGDGLAYWINLYNAVTLRLILENYPLESIKDLGGFLKTSPWKRELVTVGEQGLSLNDIENRIIRPTYGEPRIHFALNCASVSCPPLRPAAFLPDSMDLQLDAACTLAMNRDAWVRVEEGDIRVTRIFDWYEDDFTRDGGSVVAFINRFRRGSALEEGVELSYLPYDWSLNQAR